MKLAKSQFQVFKIKTKKIKRFTRYLKKLSEEHESNYKYEVSKNGTNRNEEEDLKLTVSSLKINY